MIIDESSMPLAMKRLLNRRCRRCPVTVRESAHYLVEGNPKAITCINNNGGPHDFSGDAEEVN